MPQDRRSRGETDPYLPPIRGDQTERGDDDAGGNSRHSDPKCLIRIDRLPQRSTQDPALDRPGRLSFYQPPVVYHQPARHHHVPHARRSLGGIGKRGPVPHGAGIEHHDIGIRPRAEPALARHLRHGPFQSLRGHQAHLANRLGQRDHVLLPIVTPQGFGKLQPTGVADLLVFEV